MYLQDNTARFYDYTDPNSMAFEFKVKPVCYFDQQCHSQSYFFEAEFTQRMQEFFEKIKVKTYEFVGSQIYIRLNPNGTVGWVPYIECE